MNIPEQPTIPPMPIKYAEITIEEAIENLQFYLDTPFPKRASAADLYTINRHKEALSMAIEALKLEKSYYDEMAEVKSIAEGDEYEQT